MAEQLHWVVAAAEQQLARGAPEAGRSLMEPAIVIAGIPVYLERGALRWTAGLAIDADGAPDAYAPAGSGLKPRDALANAGRPGNWWGIVTDTGRPDGTPLVQTASDPCPGYYISSTALIDRSRPRRDPRRYVDSSRVPYLAIPRELLRLGIKLGDVAHVAFGSLTSPGVVADVGPRGKLGEGSIALARALGLDPSPRRGGTDAGVECVVFCGSSMGWPRSVDQMAAQTAALMPPPNSTGQLGCSSPTSKR